MRAPVSELIAYCDAATWKLLQEALPDLQAAGVIAAITHTLSAEPPHFEITLAA